MVTPATEMSTRVSTDLLNDPRTKNFAHQVEVIADRGIVTLSGTVPNETVRQAAEEIARQSPGVITVQDELKIGGK